MKILGLYEGFWSTEASSPIGKIEEFTRKTPPSDEEAVRDYLMNGHEIFVAMGVIGDVLGSDYRIVGGDSIFTDGEWVWRGDLWFYVHRYHVSLPEEFLEKVRSHNYEVPSVPDSILEEIHVQATAVM